MRSIITLILAATLLCACTEVWQRPDTPQQVAAADIGVCHARAAVDGYSGIAGYDYVIRCMNSLGYRATVW